MRLFLYTALLFIIFPVNAQKSFTFNRLDLSREVFGDSIYFHMQADSSYILKAPADTNKVSIGKKSAYDFGTCWRISVQMNLNPSNNNNIKFYILSDSIDLGRASNAYYVVIGNNADEISLYTQTAHSATKVIDGTDKRLNLDTVRVEVMVHLDEEGNFRLWSKLDSEEDYYEEGTAKIKRGYPGTKYTGVVCTYSSKNRNKYTIRDLGISPPARKKETEEERPEGGVGEAAEGSFTLSAKSFTNGGEPVYLNYSFPEEGYTGRIITFDEGGNKVEELANNTLLLKEGHIQLKGSYPEGRVILFAEARDKNGKFIRKKLILVCGR